jgi:pyruvate/2-oxoacid:ferredoxin oxidoreductase beta subunit
MAGGGDHWEDYVITRDRNFIHNGCGESLVSTFISCPEGNYIKVVHIGEDYELEEGETDMYEMVQECFIEEIMEYCEEEDHIPTDSDEEEEKEEEEEVVKDINGKEVKIPTEEECQIKFGVSREVWIELVKKSEIE